MTATVIAIGRTRSTVPARIASSRSEGRSLHALAGVSAEIG